MPHDPSRPRQSRSRRQARLHFDRLEPRITPTTFVWISGGDHTSWTDPNNWAQVLPGNNQPIAGVPTPYSNVIFPALSLLPSGSSATINLDFAYLGLPLNSFTIADSYTFDGNPLTIESSLDTFNSYPSVTTTTFLNTGLYFAAGAVINTGTNSSLDIASSTDLTGLQLNLAGALTKLGGGQLEIDTQNITYPNTAPFAPTPLGVASGTLTIGTSATLTGINVQVSKNSSLIIADNAALKIGTLTGSGTVQLEGTTAAADTTAFSVNVPYATSATFNGLIDGVGQFTNAGNGTLNTAAIDFSNSGSIQVPSGTLLVHGPISVGSLQVGTLGSFGGTGVWTVSGPAVFQTGSTFDVVLNGTTAGSQYTQLTDTSSAGITLNFASLSATVSYEYQQSDLFNILSAPVITGGFGNVVAGSVELAGNIPFNVTSTSTSVSLTALNSLTTTRLTSSAPVIHPGQPTTLIATVTTRTAPVSSGSVSFLAGGVVVATVPLASNGTATFTSSSLPLGTTKITAAYSGSSNILSSVSASLNQSIVPYATTTILESLTNPGLPGQPVTLVALVTAGGIPVTSGTVTFRRGLHLLGSAPISSSGIASLTISTLPLGKSHLQATFNGTSSDFSSASALFTQSVVPYATATAISLARTATARNILEATVQAAGYSQPVNAGSVIFRRNGVILGRAKIHDGFATFLLRKRTRLTANFTAAYQGTSLFRPSTSPTV